MYSNKSKPNQGKKYDVHGRPANGAMCEVYYNCTNRSFDEWRSCGATPRNAGASAAFGRHHTSGVQTYATLIAEPDNGRYGIHDFRNAIHGVAGTYDSGTARCTAAPSGTNGYLLNANWVFKPNDDERSRF